MKKALKTAGIFFVAFICMLSIASVGFSQVKAAGDYEKDIFYFLKNEMGMNDAAACGILANIEEESGFRPTLSGDDGTSYGICQWHGSRFTDLKNFCSEKGYSYKTLTGQLYFLKHELEARYPTMLSKIRRVENTAEGAYSSGYTFCYDFERPSNKEYKSQLRGESAQIYWESYGVLPDIMPQTLNSVSKNNTVSSAEGFEITWKSGEGKYNRNRLHIVKQIPGTVSYDWDNEEVYITSLYTLKYKVNKGQLSEGSYLVWVEPWHTVKEKAGQSSKCITVNVFDELFSEVESDVENAVFDASAESSVDISGWTVNTGRYPVDVYLSLDGEKGVLTEKASRRDISFSEEYSAFCNDENVGFQVSLPLSDLSNGEHTVTLTAKSESVTEIIAEFSFKVINGHDHSFTAFKSNKDATYLSDGTKTAKCDLCNTRRTLTEEGTKLILGVTSSFTAKAKDTEVTLSWNAVKGATGYRIYVYNSGWKAVKTTTAKSYTVTGLTQNQSYKFAVKAYGKASGEYYWAPKYVTVQTVTTPSVPDTLTAMVTSDSVTLKWNGTQGAKGYRIFEYNDETKKWEIVLRATHKTSATIELLSPGTSYTFAVRPYYNTGSEIIWAYNYIKTAVYTKLAAPELKAAHSSASGRVTISWSKSPDSTGYQIWVSETKSTGYKKVSNFTIRSTYLYDYESGKTYYFKVRAYKKVPTGYIYSDYTPATAIKIK